MIFEGKKLGGSVSLFVVGILVGFFVYKTFFSPKFEETKEVETIVRTEYVPTTVPLPFKDFVIVTVPDPVYLKDTVIKEVVYPINKFSGSERTIYGDLQYDITTAGELIDFKFKPNFVVNTLVPVNTILTKEKTTKVVKPRGLYATGHLMGTNFGVGATYLNNKFLVGYSYQPNLRSHNLSVGYRIF